MGATVKLNGAKKVRAFHNDVLIIYLLDDMRLISQSYSSYSGGAYGEYRTLGRLKEGREDTYFGKLIAEGYTEVSPYKERQKSDSTPKNLDWRSIFRQAHEAGTNAANACVPKPMVVVERANPLDDSSPVVHQYEPIADGVCGFAWVTIKPANSQAAKFAVDNYGARKDSYESGVSIWIGQFNQSHAKKRAYAYAFAGVLVSHGIRAYAGDRLD